MRVSEDNGCLSRLKNSNPLSWLLIAYGFAVLFYTLTNGYCKHILVYNDEPIYYSVAEGLAKGLGFPTIFGEPYPTKRLLYSVLITPAFLTGSRILQFRLIALINALVMGSGAFPVYLLARDVLKNRRCAALLGAAYLIQPDLQFTAGFMAENAMLPFALWVICFAWMLAEKEAPGPYRKLGYFAGWGLSSAMLLFVKPSGYVVVIVSFVYYTAVLAGSLLWGALRRKAGGKAALGVVALAVISIAICFVFYRYSGLWSYIFSHASGILRKWNADLTRYIRCYVFTLASEIFAVGFFPFVLPLLSYRQLSKEAKSLFCFLLFLTLTADVAVTETSVRIQGLLKLQSFPLYHRYILYLWLPYFVVFADALTHDLRISPMGTVLPLIGVAAFCILFQGPIMISSFEASLLYWAKGWMEHRWFWTTAVILFTAAGFILLRNQKRWFVCCFSLVMLALQVYNQSAMHTVLHRDYRFPYPEIEPVESFITAHPDSTFLVARTPVDSYKGQKDYSSHETSKIADTYLLYPNSYLVSDAVIRAAETAEGTDLASTETALTKRTDLRTVDYLVLSNEMQIDETGCETVLDNPLFTVFRLNDPAHLPYMETIRWGKEGKLILLPKNGFSSQYRQDGILSFSSDENPSYVLYGPYVFLPPGSYTVTIHYDYTGEQEGRIGLMDLMGSAFETGEYQAEAFSNQDSVSISFDLDTECMNFEVRLFAETEGITVKTIAVEYAKPAATEDTAAAAA